MSSKNKSVKFAEPYGSSSTEANVYYREQVIQRQITAQPTETTYFYDEGEENDLNFEDNPAKFRQHGNNRLGPFARSFNCPFCGTDTHTVVEEVPSRKTHCLAAILCISCCCYLSLQPYTSKKYHNVKHYCKRCDLYIGTYINKETICSKKK